MGKPAMANTANTTRHRVSAQPTPSRLRTGLIFFKTHPDIQNNHHRRKASAIMELFGFLADIRLHGKGLQHLGILHLNTPLTAFGRMRSVPQAICRCSVPASPPAFCRRLRKIPRNLGRRRNAERVCRQPFNMPRIYVVFTAVFEHNAAGKPCIKLTPPPYGKSYACHHNAARQNKRNPAPFKKPPRLGFFADMKHSFCRSASSCAGGSSA